MLMKNLDSASLKNAIEWYEKKGICLTFRNGHIVYEGYEERKLCKEIIELLVC